MREVAPCIEARNLFVGPYLDQRSPDAVLAHEPPDLALPGSQRADRALAMEEAR